MKARFGAGGIYEGMSLSAMQQSSTDKMRIIRLLQPAFDVVACTCRSLKEISATTIHDVHVTSA